MGRALLSDSLSRSIPLKPLLLSSGKGAIWVLLN